MTEHRGPITAAMEAGEAGDYEGAWRHLAPLRGELEGDAELAWAWCVLAGNAPPGRAVDREALEIILDAWFDRPSIVLVTSEQLLDLVDGRAADEPIPEDDPTAPAIDALEACLGTLLEEQPAAAADPEVGGALWNALGNAHRLAGPDHDAEAEAAYAEALERDPENGWWRFNLGLLFKHRGRWDEGAALFERVRELVGNEKPVLWNLALCATAAGSGEAAAQAWERLGFETELGPDGLPRVADLGEVMVRLSTGGIGAAHPRSDPVDFEHVWVRPQSPCHGEVLQPTAYPVGVDIGDVVLWDGAPVGFRRVDDVDVPRFPLLLRLRPGSCRTFPFRGRQEARGDLTTLGGSLPEHCLLYVFDEQLELCCAQCIRTGGQHDPSHQSPSPAAGPGTVLGKLVFDPSSGKELAEVALLLEAALARAPGLSLAVPALYRALGDDAAAALHEARWASYDEES